MLGELDCIQGWRHCFLCSPIAQQGFVLALELFNHLALSGGIGSRARMGNRFGGIVLLHAVATGQCGAF